MNRALWFGIRGRLLLAFGVLSAFTLFASIVGWVSHNRLGDELNRVVEENIYALQLMADIRERGAKITTTTPTLLAVKDEVTRENIWQDLNKDIRSMLELLPQITIITQDLQAKPLLQEQIQTLKTTLKALNTNVLRRLETQREKRSDNRRLRWAATVFLSDIDEIISGTQNNLYRHFDQAIPHIVQDNQVQKSIVASINNSLQALYKVKADVNLLVNLVDRAQHLPDLNSLVATRTHSDEVVQRIERELNQLLSLPKIETLKQTVDKIITLANNKNNIFILRREERSIISAGQSLLVKTHKELANLNYLLGVQADKVQLAAQLSAQNARVTIRKGRVLMVSLVAGSLLFSILIVWLYVGRNMVARITHLDASMRAIANGNLDREVPIKGRDEIGAMARSLMRFRDQLATLQEELVQAGKLAAQGQLSAGIAHEINQPLSAIRQYTHNSLRLIQANRLPETEQNLQQIHSLTKRAITIITRLKSLAKEQQNNFVTVDIKTTINNVISLFSEDNAWRAATVNVQYTHPSNKVYADPIQLEQVIQNLITNSLDAIANNSEKEILIDCKQNKDHIELWLSDNGPGIDKLLQKQIFDPFFTTKRRGQNLGLGLSISYNIIQNFGGKLSIDTSREQGAAFCILLPKLPRGK